MKKQYLILALASMLMFSTACGSTPATTEEKEAASASEVTEQEAEPVKTEEKVEKKVEVGLLDMPEDVTGIWTIGVTEPYENPWTLKVAVEKEETDKKEKDNKEKKSEATPTQGTTSNQYVASNPESQSQQSVGPSSVEQQETYNPAPTPSPTPSEPDPAPVPPPGPTPAPTPEPQPEPTPAPTPEPAHEHTWVAITETVHHDAVTEQVWVVDRAAWCETVEIGHDDQHMFCNICDMDLGDGYGDEYKVHKAETGHMGFYTSLIYVSDGTEIIEHPEEGHYETKVTQEAYDETITTGYRCSGCGVMK